MTNGEKHIEKLLSWYKEAVTEDGVCYLTSDDKNTLAYALKCCKHFEDIKKDIDTWMLRNNPSGSEKPNKSEIPTGQTTKNDLAHNLCDSCTNIGCEFQSGIVRTECAFYMPPHIEPDNCGNYVVQDSTTKNDLGSDAVTPTRKKGKWLGDKAYPICSKCNCNIIEEYISCSDYVEMYKPMKFCPNCGAKMEEVEV